MDAGRQASPHANPPGVLVVDDYAPNLMALRALLSPIASVTDVDSGARAIEAVRGSDFAVVMLDIRMPRMDGIEVARRIRAGNRNAQVPIIFMTAMDSDAAQILDGYAVGAVDYLRRPFEPTILRSKVSIFVELYQHRERAKHEAAERSRLQAERAAAEQASRDKDQFLGLLSHELRTPLTSILLWSDMLLNKTLPPETVRRGLETVQVCAQREANMVENVLEMSRLVTGALTLELTAVDMNELVAGVLSDLAGLAAERQVQLNGAWEPIRRHALGDPARLRRVLHNLFENAVHFTPPGGRVDVSVEDGPSGFSIHVKDTGIGFLPEQEPSLFSRWRRTNSRPTRSRGGLGLGLPLAKGLIELHGGAITAQSEGAGMGAWFRIALPHARLTESRAPS